MSPTRTVTVLEQCRVAPPPTVTDQSIPLTFLDIPWIALAPVRRLIFYQHPISSSHFLHSLVPRLKDSLTHTLRFFFTVAGRLISSIGSDPGCRPHIRYVAGDSVPLTIAESTADFQTLTANHPRPAEQFHPLVPEIRADPTELLVSSAAPLLALQVTLFPEAGFCIGVSNNHTVGDGSSIFNFVRAWAFFARFGGDTESPYYDSLPLYDRSVVEDPKDLLTVFLRSTEHLLRSDFSEKITSANKARATLTLDGAQIQRLKQAASVRRPALQRPSTFIVACGYVWSCIVKSRPALKGTVDPDEEHHFGCAGDGRDRPKPNPPIPTNYFGNCLTFIITAAAKSRQLTAEDGFATAAELIGAAVRETMYGEEGVFGGAERWFSMMGSVNWETTLRVAGSPRFNYYDLDFGSGKACKVEIVSIDDTGSISVGARRQSDDGGIEVGLVLPDSQMDAFVSIFADGLARL